MLPKGRPANFETATNASARFGNTVISEAGLQQILAKFSLVPHHTSVVDAIPKSGLGKPDLAINFPSSK